MPLKKPLGEGAVASPTSESQVTEMAEFEGKSENGSLQEALNDALDKAMQSGNRADLVVTYRLKTVTGVCGGVPGSNRLVVTIEAQVH